MSLNGTRVWCSSGRMTTTTSRVSTPIWFAIGPVPFREIRGKITLENCESGKILGPRPLYG
jgi:hypothetical protein